MDELSTIARVVELSDDGQASTRKRKLDEDYPSYEVPFKPRIYKQNAPRSISQPHYQLHRQLKPTLSRQRWKTEGSTQQDRSRYPAELGSDADSSASLTKLRRSCYETLMGRLRLRGCNSRLFENQQLFNCVLPASYDLVSWRTLLDEPYLMDPDQVAQILDLRTVSSRRDWSEGITLYIRTWSISATDLHDVLSQLITSDCDIPSHALGWLDALESLVDGQQLQGDEVFYIRYCGQTTIGIDQRNRYDPRLSASAEGATGFLARFLATVAIRCPEVLSSVVLQEVSAAKAVSSIASELCTARKQALIALFGNWVLNTQPGGGRGDISFSESDKVLFESLQTSTVRLFEQLEPCSTEVNAAVKEYVLAVQHYANDNAAITGCSKCPFSDEHVASYYASAQPSAIRGSYYAPIVHIGSDNCISVFKHRKWLLDHKVPSGHAIMDVYDHLRAWETSEPHDDAYTYKLVRDHRLPCVDLFPWPRKDGTLLYSSLSLLRQYLRVSKPLVVVCYSKLVSQVSLGNFNGTNGIGHRTFRDLLGDVYLRNYGDDPTNPKDDDWVVVIPMVHPGSLDKSGSNKDESVQLFVTLCSCLWLCFGEAVIASQLALPTKKDRCERIISEVQRKLAASGKFEGGLRIAKDKLMQLAREQGVRRTFHTSQLSKSENLDLDLTSLPSKSKNPDLDRGTSARYHTRKAADVARLKGMYGDCLDFVMLEGRKRLLLEAPVARWKAAKAELDIIISCDRARGLPGSKQRREQSKVLWAKHITSLRVTHVTQRMFDKITQNLSQGSFIWREFRAHYDLNPLDDVPNLICSFLPEELVSTAQDLRSVEKSLAHFVVDGIFDFLQPHFNSDMSVTEMIDAITEPWTQCVQRRDPSSYARIFEKLLYPAPLASAMATGGTQSEVTVESYQHAKRMVRLRLQWKDEGKQVHNLNNLRLPELEALIDANKKYHMQFVASGVDILDEEGQPVGVGPSTKHPTVPLSAIGVAMIDHPKLKFFFRLWERKTGYKVEDVVSDGRDYCREPAMTLCVPSSYFAGRQLPGPAIDRGAKSVKLGDFNQDFPLQPGDFLWLLDRFLQEEYPQGGEIDCAPPVLRDFLPTVFHKIERFTTFSRWLNHPYIWRLAVIPALAAERYGRANATKFFMVAVEALRTGVKCGEQKMSWTKGFEKHEASRRTIKFSATPPPNLIHAPEIPELCPQERVQSS